MLFLTTGANGAGKTLLTLKHVRDLSVKENRPVYHNGRFEAVEGGELASWKTIDIKDWQTVPDGAIFVVDECHNDFPVRSAKQEVPEYIRMLAEHRRRGFDFYLITQHPQNIDIFIRRLIGSPGWHRHLKRASGAPLVSQLEWPAVNGECEKPGAGASGQVSMVTYPKEVYGWYRSSSLNTAKIKIPFQVKLLIGLVLTMPVVGYLGYSAFKKTVEPKTAATSKPGEPGAPGQQPATAQQVQTPAQYVDTFKPRIEGLAYTAARYDDITKPVNVPYPAACIAMANRCECYTTQGTKLQTPKELCNQIVKNGFFMEWQAPNQSGSKLTGGPSTTDKAPPQDNPQAVNDGTILASMRANKG